MWDDNGEFPQKMFLQTHEIVTRKVKVLAILVYPFKFYTYTVGNTTMSYLKALS